jgi:hypothetical protein
MLEAVHPIAQSRLHSGFKAQIRTADTTWSAMTLAGWHTRGGCQVSLPYCCITDLWDSHLGKERLVGMSQPAFRL